MGLQAIVFVLSLLCVVDAQFYGIPEGYTVIGGPDPLIYLVNPWLVYYPEPAVLGVGWTCFALFTLLLFASVGLYVWEALRKKSGSSSSASSAYSNARSGPSGRGHDGSNQLYVSPFLFTASAFCITRMITISIQLSVRLLYNNVIVSGVFECIGNILFLLTFTFIALSWCNMIIRADLYREHMVRLKYALWIGWIVASIGIGISFVLFASGVSMSFGVGVHDGFYANATTKVAIEINPGDILGIPNSVVKPHASMITQRDLTHYSFMALKGIYGCYGFLLGCLFIVLSIIIIAKMVSANTALGGDGAKKLRRTVISILIVSIPVALTFALIFIMIAIEVSIHRHGDYYEYYITQFLASEIVALTVLLVHYWRAGLRSYIKEKRDSARSGSGSASAGSAKSLNSGRSAEASGKDSGVSSNNDNDSGIVEL